jgi:hypothetical protein
MVKMDRDNIARARNGKAPSPLFAFWYQHRAHVDLFHCMRESAVLQLGCTVNGLADALDFSRPFVRKAREEGIAVDAIQMIDANAFELTWPSRQLAVDLSAQVLETDAMKNFVRNETVWLQTQKLRQQPMFDTDGVNVFPLRYETQDQLESDEIEPTMDLI